MSQQVVGSSQCDRLDLGNVYSIIFNSFWYNISDDSPFSSHRGNSLALEGEYPEEKIIRVKYVQLQHGSRFVSNTSLLTEWYVKASFSVLLGPTTMMVTLQEE